MMHYRCRRRARRRRFSAGLVEPVIFDNEDSGFCVSRLKAHGQRRLITALGHEAPISADEGIAVFRPRNRALPGSNRQLGGYEPFPRSGLFHAGGGGCDPRACRPVVVAGRPCRARGVRGEARRGPDLCPAPVAARSAFPRRAAGAHRPNCRTMSRCSSTSIFPVATPIRAGSWWLMLGRASTVVSQLRAAIPGGSPARRNLALPSDASARRRGARRCAHGVGR